MPRILRWLTRLCFGFGLFLPMSLIPLPFGFYRINGVEVTFAEFWRQGGGPTFFAIGAASLIVAYGFVRARNWSRYIFAGLQHAFWIITPLFTGFSFEMLFSLAWAAFVTYYLFFRPEVRAYFTHEDAEI